MSGCIWGAAGQTTPDPIAPVVNALERGDFAQALRLSRTALAQHPEDYRLWTLQGMATAGMGKLPEALTSYRRALKLAPGYLAALEGAAQAEFQRGDAGARPLLRKVLDQRPDDPTAHTLLAILATREGKCAEAVAHFQKGGAAAAHRPEAMTDYGSCLAALQRGGDAVKAFTQALALDPEQPQARFNLALAQWNDHEGKAALETLRPLTDAKPDADALELAAEIHESAGETSEAVALLRQALLADPRNVEAYLQFATLSFDHASPQVGIEILNAGLTQLPKEPRLYLVRGILRAQMGEFPQATEDFEAASRIDPQLQFLGVAEGIVRSQQHNSQEALAHFRASVREHPKEAYAHYLLAEALEQEGKPEGSAEYREEVAAAKQAVQLDPGLVAAHDLLSTVYYRSGHTDLVIEQSRAALAHHPDDEHAVYHLLLALRKEGHTDEVRTLVKRLVELRTNSRVNESPHKRYYLYVKPAQESTQAP